MRLPRPLPPPRQNWFLFALAAIIMASLCFWGGRFGFIGKYPLDLAWLTSIFPRPLVLPAGRFMILFALTWFACLALVVVFPRRLGFGGATAARGGATVILTLALLCRLLLLPHPHSNDVNRYLWEGRLLAAGYSPYVHAPVAENDPAVDPLRAASDPYWSGINHPRMSAIYPPLALWLFAGVARLWYAAAAIKLIMIAFDLGALVFLLLILRARGLELRWACLYAFNPVVLYSFAGQGHLDAALLFFVTGALFFSYRRRWLWMFVFAGLAVQAKYVAIVALPFLLRRDNWRYAWVAAAAMLLPYLPFIATDGGAVLKGLFAFGSEFAVNGPVHGLVRLALDDRRAATWICMAALSLTLIWGWRFHPAGAGRDPGAGSFFALAALLLFLPTVHYWYLTWIIPFLALRPTASWLGLCLTICFYFVADGLEHHTGAWSLPPLAQAAIWLPFLALLLHELRLARKRARRNWEPPSSLSVIIPARNEEACLRACIESARDEAGVAEIIVVDGGSTDRTREVARQAGARVIEHPAPPEAGGGRGGQVSAGVSRAVGDVVVILHADTLISPGTFQRILTTLTNHPEVIGGAVGSGFDAPGWRLRLLEVANDFRAAFLGLSFGDQVQFFRRAPVLERGLVPDIPLMEDVELALRLRLLGRTAYLWGDCRVSARRWQSRGYWRSLLVIRLVASYLWQRLWGRPDTARMYRRYYRARE